MKIRSCNRNLCKCLKACRYQTKTVFCLPQSNKSTAHLNISTSATHKHALSYSVFPAFSQINTNQSPKLSFQVEKCRASCHKHPASLSQRKRRVLLIHVFAAVMRVLLSQPRPTELPPAKPHLCCMMGVFIAKGF